MEKFMLGYRYNLTKHAKEKVTLKVFFKNSLYSIGCW